MIEEEEEEEENQGGAGLRPGPLFSSSLPLSQRELTALYQSRTGGLHQACSGGGVVARGGS